jgi:hypothetical protein
MVARLRSQFGLDEVDEEPAEDTPPEVGEPDEEEPEPPEPAEEEPAQAVAHAPAADRINVDGREYIIIDGQPVSVDEIRQARRLADERASQPQPEPEPEPEVPEWLDLDDPSQKFFWSQLQAQNKALNQIAQTQAQGLQEQARSKAQNDVDTAMATFRSAHPELTENDIGVVRLHAVSLDIIDGLARNRTGVDAVLKALDIAYLDHPEFRAKQAGEPTPTEVKATQSKERKSKLGALSGSSGSAPRTETPRKPESDREAREQASQFLRDQGLA